MENADDACRPDNFHSQQLTYSTLVRKYQCLFLFHFILLPLPPPQCDVSRLGRPRRCGRRLHHLAGPPERHVVTSRYRQRSKKSGH